MKCETWCVTSLKYLYNKSLSWNTASYKPSVTMVWLAEIIYDNKSVVWLGEDRTKFMQSKSNLETNPSDILSNEITGTLSLYQYNWDQIVALHLDFKQACTTLWWLIIFVAVQANITRVNSTYYSDLNLVFHGEVSDEDQGSSDLCRIVHNWLRFITQSLVFLWIIKILIVAKGRISPLAAHTSLGQARGFRSHSVYAGVQSQNVHREGHGLGDLSAFVACG